MPRVVNNVRSATWKHAPSNSQFGEVETTALAFPPKHIEGRTYFKALGAIWKIYKNSQKARCGATCASTKLGRSFCIPRGRPLWPRASNVVPGTYTKTTLGGGNANSLMSHVLVAVSRWLLWGRVGICGLGVWSGRAQHRPGG